MLPSLALLLAVLVAVPAWRVRALTASGAVAAVGVGALVLAGTGWAGGAALLAFFAGSSVVSRLGEARTPRGVDAKGNQRDAVQVLANGGVAAAGGLWGLGFDPVTGMAVVLCALAAAGADTWATSLGAFSRLPPVHLVRWERVSTGTSGAVSWAGTLGGLAGGAVVALAGWAGGVLLPSTGATVTPALAGAAAAVGVAGMALDSLLGATVQGRFRCPSCTQPSERRRHRCGSPTDLTEGCRWVDNDVVNTLTTTAAGLAGAALLS